MRSPARSIVALSLSILGACSATSPQGRYEQTGGHGFGIEARWLAYDDFKTEGTLAGTGFVEDELEEVEGYGVQLATLGAPGFVVGWDERDYDKADGSEVHAGVRWIFGADDVRPYLAGNARYGFGLELDEGAAIDETDGYWGWSAGGGLIAFLTDRIYVDVGILYEDVLSEIDADAAEIDLQGWAGTLGLGFGF